jgi:formylglycine-generating enzyme required for sulfatase activity
VGTKAANELGIYDMSGNVSEWCWDLYDLYPYPLRRVRGGSFYGLAVTVADRDYNGYPGNGYDSIGFRLARSSGN